MNLMRIENRLKVLEADNARMHACTSKGKLYVPGSPTADEGGCAPLYVVVPPSPKPDRCWWVGGHDRSTACKR